MKLSRLKESILFCVLCFRWFYLGRRESRVHENQSRNNTPLKHNGPAIWRGCVTRRNSGRTAVLVLWHKMSFGRKRRVWRTFCRHGTSNIEHYECRGTSSIGAANLSPVTNLVAFTGAVAV